MNIPDISPTVVSTHAAAFAMPTNLYLFRLADALPTPKQWLTMPTVAGGLVVVAQGKPISSLVLRS